MTKKWNCENASQEFKLDKVRSMIEHQKSKFGWEFLFLGANIDAVETADTFGISADRAVTYEADNVGTKMNFEAVNEAVTCMRKCRYMDENWKKDIEDYRNSKKKQIKHSLSQISREADLL